MTPSQPNLLSEPAAARSTTAAFSRASAWYYLMFSPEHGVYVMLLVSFLVGAAAAQQWIWATTLALICAFAGFQAEHQGCSRLNSAAVGNLGFWFGVALMLASPPHPHLELGWVELYLQTPMLLWLYLGAIAVFMIDGVSVFDRQQKSVTLG
jgi:hypothetical protein